MKVTIDVPEEFSTDYASRFQDFWNRVITDMHNMIPGDLLCDLLCDNYEYEVAEMFREAFEKGEYENLGEN